jgi:hypothetical protein
MMKDVFDIAKWFLEKDLRAKNSVSFLVALLSVVVFFVLSHGRVWFEELQGYGTAGVALAHLVVFLIAFLTTLLIYSPVARVAERKGAERKAEEEALERQKALRENLNTLTPWQRGFLLRFVTENRTQIPEFEVGQYRAAWDFEMDVLIEKAIVKEHRRSGVYEIEPIYHHYLLEHWNPKTGALE